MALTPQEINNRSTQAEEAFKNKDYNRSVTLLTSITQENPDYAPAYMKLGYIWMRTETPTKALPYLSKVIELAPKAVESWVALGKYHKHIKAFPEALDAFQKALAFSGENAQIYHQILQIHRTLGNHSAALPIAQKLLEMEPESITTLWEYAQVLKDNEDTKEALKQYKILINKEGADIPIEAIKQWHALMKQYRQFKEARDWLSKQEKANPKNAVLKWLYGHSCADSLEYDEALSVLKEAYRLEPDNAEIAYGIGSIYYIMGNKEQSDFYYQKVLKSNPIHSVALRSIGVTHKYSYGDDAFNRLNFAATYLQDMSVEEKSHLHYALGKAYDDVEDLATAFEHFRRAGIHHSQGNQKELNELSLMTNFFQDGVTKATFEACAGEGCQSDKPLFILGMPRSGTTLMEQVLSSINGVYGAGELSYATDALDGIGIEGKKLRLNKSSSVSEKASYRDRGEHYLSLVEKLAPEGSRRIIDKMPDNFKFTGLIHLILPNASIIHSRRHPVETCLSAYRLHFTEGHYWSDDLKTMGQYYRKYAEIMAFWKQVLPEGTILEVRYEDMVADLETQSRRLIEHIGMPWDPVCLNFHESKRAVNTASAAQVRKPIYKTSIGRWRKYEHYLKPLLDEIGDLVEEYEAELVGGR